MDTKTAGNAGYGAIYILQTKNSPPCLKEKDGSVGQERLQFTSLRTFHCPPKSMMFHNVMGEVSGVQSVINVVAIG